MLAPSTVDGAMTTSSSAHGNSVAVVFTSSHRLLHLLHRHGATAGAQLPAALVAVAAVAIVGGTLESHVVHFCSCNCVMPSARHTHIHTVHVSVNAGKRRRKTGVCLEAVDA